MSKGVPEYTGAAAIEALEFWRPLVEPEASRGITAVPWEQVLKMSVRVFEGARSVIVTRDVAVAGGMARSIWVAAGELEEVLRLVDEVECSSRRDRLVAVLFLGRRGWLRAADGYHEEAVLGVKEL